MPEQLGQRPNDPQQEKEQAHAREEETRHPRPNPASQRRMRSRADACGKWRGKEVQRKAQHEEDVGDKRFRENKLRSLRAVFPHAERLCNARRFLGARSPSFTFSGRRRDRPLSLALVYSQPR